MQHPNWVTINNNVRLEQFKINYPEFKIPKYKIGDTVKCKQNAFTIHQSIVPFDASDDRDIFEEIINNDLLIIEILHYSLKTPTFDRSTEIFYYKFNDIPDFYIVEEALMSKKPDYNKPMKLVYEHLKPFNDFLFENNENNLFTFRILPRLLSILNELSHTIAKQLVQHHTRTNKKTNVTYLDVDENTEQWGFVNSIKANQFLIEVGSNISHYNEVKFQNEIYNKYKSVTRIGRIIHKIYGDLFKDNQIEEFINEYKRMFIINFDLVDIVKGEDIVKYYHHSSYDYTGDTPLSNSCMRYDECDKYLNFYEVNSDKVSLVVLYSDETHNKISARAILWKIDEIENKKVDNVYFMDRVYYNSQKDLNTLLKYAEEKEWYFKLEQNSSNGYIVVPESNLINQILVINDIYFSTTGFYPYMDTLCYMDVKKMTLTNNPYTDSNYIAELRSTNGRTIGLKWSNYYNEFLSPAVDDLVVADINDSGYQIELRKQDAILLPKYNRYYEKNYFEKIKPTLVEAIINTPYSKTKKIKGLIFKKDARFSKLYNEYFLHNLVEFSKYKQDYLLGDECVFSYLRNDYLLPTECVRVIIDMRFDYFNKTPKFLLRSKEFIKDSDYYLKNEDKDKYFEYRGFYFSNKIKDKIKIKDNLFTNIFGFNK